MRKHRSKKKSKHRKMDDQTPRLPRFQSNIWRRFGVAFGIFGVVAIGSVLIISQAAGPVISVEPEILSLNGNAVKTNDGSASAGSYVSLSAATLPACAPSGGVSINTSDNAQNIINSNPAGTTYIVKSGTHQSNFSIQPKSGDKFCGEPGAIVDGGNTLVNAITGTATNVMLDDFTVQNYNTGWQGAAIKPHVSASNWTVRNMTVRNNYWAGMLIA